MDINELVEETSIDVMVDLEEMMLEGALDASLSIDVDNYDHLYTLFAERFDKSRPELSSMISKILVDTLSQLQKDSIWRSF